MRADLRGARGPSRWTHAGIVAVLATGVLLRILLTLGFHPAFWDNTSAAYVDGVEAAGRSGTAGLGYSFLELSPLSRLTDDSVLAVSAVQHLAGLGAALAVYVLCLRWGVWRWLAVLAAAVPALDPRLMVAEHSVLPDTLFVALISLTLLVLLWGRGRGLGAASVAGLLLGAAAAVLSTGAALLVVGVLAWVLIGAGTRTRVVGAAALARGFMLVWLPYAVWWVGTAGWRGPSGLVGGDGVDGWGHPIEYLAPSGVRWGPAEAAAESGEALPVRIASAGGHLTTRHPFDDAFAHYAGFVSLPAWLLAVALVLGVAGAVGVGRAGRSPVRVACAVVVAVPLAAWLGIAFGPEHSWHANLVLLVWGPAAGALGVTALMRGARSAATRRPQADDVDHEALGDFAKRYGETELAPVVVVIAAYNEATGLPGVLATLPDLVCDLHTDVLVVDDGSTDGTFQAAESDARAYVASCSRHRGQGAALRLGYRIAREHGAHYIITTDADGQYDSQDFPVVLAPLLDGEADFVTGSRRLGHQHTYDRFRRLGVHVFAWIATLLTGVWLTDTSFGLRAMRADVTAAVTLNQPQYQSAELLLGVVSHGYRVREVPGTMHVRAGGSTKKGRNLVYGTRYARVVFGTWWREGCPRPAADRAAAQRVR